MMMNNETLQKNFLALKAENEALRYQFDYLRQHVDIASLPPAENALRKLQLETVTFAKEILDILKPYDIYPFMLYGALIGHIRHNQGFCPWDDDIDFGLMGADYWRLINILREDFIFLEAPSAGPFWSILDDALHEHPNKIIGFQTPYCLHIYRGTSLENLVNIEFLPYYYWHDSCTTKDFLSHAKDIRTTISQNHSWEALFFIYKDKLANNPYYCEKSNKIAAGIGTYTLTNWKFTGFYTNEQFFPLQNITFENTELPTIRNIENHLEVTYGDYMQLPRDTGITVTSSSIHDYLQTQNRKLNMLEASVICAHNG